jgi:hypothetical protein
VVEQCPSAPPQSNVGCTAWLVLAKLADISLPEPTAPLTATAAPLAGYPADRALTTAELATLLAGPALPTNTALVATVTIDAKTDVCPMNRYPTIGVIHGLDSQVCVMGAGVYAYLATASETGTFAFRYLAPGILGLLGEITPASASHLTFRAADTWPTVGSTFLVDGWLYEIDGWAGFPQVPGSVQYVCPVNTPEPAGDPLDPTGSDWCIYTWLGDSSAGPSSPFGAGDARPVEAAGVVQIDAIPTATAVYGTYVVRTVSEQCPQASSGDTRNCGRILARVADTLNLTPSVATHMPTPTPTAAPPASPLALPTGAPAAPIGLIGSGNRSLTAGEFASLWAADPAHLAGRLAVVEGPVPASFSCGPAGVAAGASTVPCHVEVSQSQIAADGHYWAVRVGSDGKLSVVGEIATPKSGFVFTLDQRVRVDGSLPDGLTIVDAWLDWEPSLACDTPPYPTGSECYGGAVWTVLTSAPLSTQPAGYPYMQTPPPGVVAVTVGIGDYQRFGSSDIMARPIHGLFLISGGKILARLAVATLP